MVILAFIFLMNLNLYASQCLDLFNKNRLTNEQQYWLSMAKSTDYKVRVLQAPSDQLVVFLGESHLKNMVSSLVGQKLLTIFEHRAHEYANTEKTWGGSFLSWHIDAEFKKIQETTNRKKPSTISDAQMSSRELQQSIKNMEVVFSSYDSFKEQYESSALNSKKPLQSKEFRELNYKNYYLENNHRPDLKENLYSVVAPTEAMSKMLILPTLILSAYMPNSFFAELALPTMVGVIGLRALQKYMGSKLENKYSNKKWFNNIFFDNLALIEARNQTKTNNIQRLLEQHPEVDILLVIVGKLHVEGMAELLKENDFSE